MAPEGMEMTVQLKPKSPAAKLLPEMVTFCSTRAGFPAAPGVKVIFGLTVTLAYAQSPVFPLIVML